MVRDVFCKNCDTKLGWMYVSVNSLFGGHLSPGSLDL